MFKRVQRDNRARVLTGAMIALVVPTALTYVWFVLLSRQPSSTQNVVMATCKTLQFSFPLAWVVLVLNQKIRVPPPARAGMFVGALFGLFVAVATVALYSAVLQPSGLLTEAAGQVQQKLRQMHWDTPERFILASVFYCVLHSLLEEYYWRWFVFGQLRTVWPLGRAIVVSSVGFAAHHVIVLANFFGWVSPWTVVLSVAVALGGVFWAWLYHRTDRIYPVWLSHLLVDAGIFLVGFGILHDSLVLCHT